MDEMLWVEAAVEEGRRRARCPRCRAEFHRVETDGVLVEACPTCGGIWFDGGELKALAQRRPGLLAGLEHRHDPAPGAAAPAAEEGSRLCPACGQPMRVFEFPWAPGVRLDGCPACHGVWADDGELTRLEAGLLRLRREGAAPPPGRAGAVHALLTPRPPAG